jgi:RNA binding exosome subunit
MAELPLMEVTVADAMADAVEKVLDGETPIFGIDIVVHSGEGGHGIEVLIVTATGQAAEKIRSLLIELTNELPKNPI